MKKTLAWIMAAVLLLPFFAFGGTGVEDRCLSLFHAEDLARKEGISEALSVGKKSALPDSGRLPEQAPGERFIVRFAETLSETELLSLLENTSYELLADSSERVFLLHLEEPQAFEEKAGDALLYCCPDRVLATAALPDDPMLEGLPEYGFLKLPQVWSNVEASSDVIVAVLDTGIYRHHEDFAGTTILNGYDFVEKHSGVEKDSVGHGTAVAGLIAATAGNGIGTAGVAYGVQILPVRIAAGAVNIYSSDLVGGLRFAADAGAQILNLSFGGYTYSAAENDAIRYARSKGCILIAAAGNGGRTERCHEECYPASYEGVISVGSCDANGVRSVFSQKTASVDILMPGENLLLLGTDANGNDCYLHDDGTSYSAALLSGLAALALSALDKDVRFGGDELEALLGCLGEWQMYDGWGAVDGMRLLRDVNLPQITGIRNGSTHIGKVTIGFNRGTATLDGEDFSDGETVYQNGSHELVVTDNAGKRTYNFRISYVPASCSVENVAGGVRITYSGGTATLDGVPVPSGTVVSTPGKHVVVLVDSYGDETRRYFTYDPDLPLVEGIEDGMTYHEPVRIRVSEGGEVLLDGAVVGNDLIVDTDGTHVLIVRKGSRTEEFAFVLQTGEELYANDLSRCSLILDEENGWYGIYGELLAGIRLYSLEDHAYLGFLETGSVDGFVRDGDRLLVFGEWQLNVIDPATVTGEALAMTTYPIRCDGFAFADGNLFCLSEQTLFSVDIESGELTGLMTVSGSEIYSDGEMLWIYDEKNNAFTGITSGLDVSESFSPALSGVGQRKLFSDGVLFCGRTAWDLKTHEAKFSYAGYALEVRDGSLYTTEGVFDRETGLLLGTYGRPVSGVVFGNEKTYLCGYAGELKTFPTEIRCYAEAFPVLPSEPVKSDPFASVSHLFGTPGTLAADGDRFVLSFESERSLLVWDGTNFASVVLPLAPIGAAVRGDSVCAWSADLVWTDGRVFAPGGKIENCFYCDDALYISSGRLTKVQDGVLSETGISAESACGSGSLVAFYRDGAVTVIKNGREHHVSVRESALLTDGEYLLSGRRVYRIGDEVRTVGMLSSDPLSVCRGAAMTANGLVELASLKFLSTAELENAALAALGTGTGLVICENGLLTRSDYDRTGGVKLPAWEEPLLIGCGNGQLYSDRTVIRYDRGMCFLDGEPCPDGQTVTQPGAHLVTLLLPCGILITRRFSVIPALESISFVTMHYHLAVGETASLHIQYLPKETSAVPLRFTVEGDCIELQDDSFLAVREGTAVILAETLDGAFSASCEVVVDGDLLRFNESSGYLVDRVAGTLSGVRQGTFAETIRTYLLTEGEVVISDDMIRTGTTIVLLDENGETVDQLTVVVTGDLDSDGMVTLADLLLLQDILQKGELPEGILSLAADMNQSGTVNDRDVRELSEWVLFIKGDANRKLPALGTPGETVLFLPSAVLEGDTLRLTILLSECPEMQAISGRLFFDYKLLSYRGYTAYGTEVQTASQRGWVSFCYTGSGDRVISPLITLEFLVHGEAEKDLYEFVLQDTVVKAEKLYSLPKSVLSFPVGQRTYGDVTLSLEGATVPFSPEQHQYTVYLPYGTPGLIYDLQYPEDCTVEAENTLFLDGDELRAVFRFLYADGTTEVYTVKGVRSDEPPQSGNCSLLALNVEGFPFAFDPDILEYRITVPNGVSSADVTWLAASEKATVFCGDTSLREGRENLITITVIAENGDRRVYRLYVYREAPETVSEAEKPKEKGSLIWLLILPALALVAVVGIQWSKQKGAKKDGND